MTPIRLPHYTLETYGFRLTVDGKTIAYSGDSGPSERLAELARDSDLFVCEATLDHGDDDGQPRGHLSVDEALEAAQDIGRTSCSAHASSRRARRSCRCRTRLRRPRARGLIGASVSRPTCRSRSAPPGPRGGRRLPTESGDGRSGGRRAATERPSRFRTVAVHGRSPLNDEGAVSAPSRSVQLPPEACASPVCRMLRRGSHVLAYPPFAGRQSSDRGVSARLDGCQEWENLRPRG